MGSKARAACGASCISRRSSPSTCPHEVLEGEAPILPACQLILATVWLEQLRTLHMFRETAPPLRFHQALQGFDQLQAGIHGLMLFGSLVCCTRRLRYHENKRARFSRDSEPRCHVRVDHANLLCVVPRLSLMHMHPPVHHNKLHILYIHIFSSLLHAFLLLLFSLFLFLFFFFSFYRPHASRQGASKFTDTSAVAERTGGSPSSASTMVSPVWKVRKKSSNSEPCWWQRSRRRRRF